MQASKPAGPSMTAGFFYALSNKRRPNMRYMVIRTENLTKTFSRQAVVKNLSMDVEPGEIFGFLGPTGAGKSTVLRMLMDTVRPSAGRALVLGMDSHRHSLNIRKMTGYLPASFSTNPRMTGQELLNYLERLRSSIDHDYALHLAEQFKANLNTVFGRLAPAERQKLGIVQAFMHRPDLIILDEPTRLLEDSALDAFSRLVHTTRAEGRTVFFTSTSLTEMERLCDRTAVLHHGELIAIERGVQLRNRALRRVEMRFASPITTDSFSCLPNLKDLQFEDNTLSCTIHGDPDALIKTASQFRVTHFVSQTPSLEEVFHQYYGVDQHAV
jgi:ABC-2 type transport system ATP-binding protein